MTDVSDIGLLATEVLSGAFDALETIPIVAPGFDGAPDRYFVSPGEPAFDCCPQLTVHVSSITDRPTTLTTTGRSCAASVSLVGLVVTIVRCVPVPDDQGNPPSMEAMCEAAFQTEMDGWALWNHLYSMWCADMLFSLCGEVFWDGMRAINPAGGCSGWTLSLRVSLDGYEDIASS